jgi:hypothetical protein
MKAEQAKDTNYEVRNFEGHVLVGSKGFTSYDEALAFATYKAVKADPIQLQAGYFTSIYEYRNGFFDKVTIYAV